MSLRVKEIMKMGADRLTVAGIADAERDAKGLYCFMMNIPTSRLILEYQNMLQDRLCDRYFELIDRRASGEPFQYITGSQDFMGLTFSVNKSVLIPRQDTETLVEDALSVMNDGTLRGEKVLDGKKRSWEILDLCTGSGCIGISIAKLASEKGLKVEVTCSDVSKDALTVAKENSKSLGTDKLVKFVESDMLTAFSHRFRKDKFDLIISNPPYIRRDVIPTLQTEVRDHEPNGALDGGVSGLDFYRIIAEKAADHLKKDGVLMMEIGHDQGEEVMGLLGGAARESDGNDSTTSPYTAVSCHKDLAGLDRVVFAKMAGKK